MHDSTTVEMENEEVFRADAELDGFERMYTGSSRRAMQKGHGTAKAALGSSEPDRDIHDEETPLISSNREDGGAEESEHGAGETRETPKWDGERDFEGRPWWNKPSVRNI